MSRHSTKTSEVWKDVVGHKGRYKVSNLGRVKSLPRMSMYKGVPNARRVGFRILKLECRKDGYYAVSLYKNSIRTHELVHRLVALAFIPNLLNKLEVNHKNGIKTDNQIGNLEWATPKENSQHATRNGWCPDNTGEKNGRAKLTKRKVRQIRRRLAAGESQMSIALDLGMGHSIISQIKLGQRWKHVV